MKKITRDIQLTLFIKFLLLIILWVVCFKGAEKNTVSLAQWLYGAEKSVPAKTGPVITQKDYS